MEQAQQEKEERRGAEGSLPGFMVIAAGGAGKASALSVSRPIRNVRGPDPVEMSGLGVSA
jgi:hypothetical protein